MIKWGILSTAKIARNAFVPAIKEAKNAELYAVASESGKAEAAAKEWGAEKHYDSYRALLEDPQVDAVYIPLPNSLHVTWAKEAARYGKHVLVEKPAALNSQEAQEMVAECNKHEVKFMEAFMYQYHPQHARVKEIIDSGEIGDVKLIRSSFTFPLPTGQKSIKLESELGGGSLYDVGCYCVHSSSLLLGEQPKEVYLTGLIDPEFNVDMTACGILQFENARAVFDSSFEQPNTNRYEVVGTKGTIKVPHAFRPDRNPDGGKGIVIVEKVDGELREEFFVASQYTMQLEHFSEAILENKEPMYTGEKTIQNMKVIEGLYESLRSQKVVTIS